MNNTPEKLAMSNTATEANEISKSGDELDGFFNWYMSGPKLLCVPAIDGVNAMEGIYGLTIFRQGQFQVQLFNCEPNTEIPDHIHPNVDSYEVYIGGSIMFRHNGIVVVPSDEAHRSRSDGLSEAVGRQIRVKPQDWHGATIGAYGGAFLSIQHWLNGIKPSSVEMDWDGGKANGRPARRLNGGVKPKRRPAPNIHECW